MIEHVLLCFLILTHVDPSEDWFVLSPTDLIWVNYNLAG